MRKTNAGEGDAFFPRFILGGMMRLFWPWFFGSLGTAVLLWLGTWQLERLVWKEAVLAEIEQVMGAVPVAVPADPDPVADRFRAVAATGRFTGQELHVLVSTKTRGAGYRIIAAFESEGRRMMVDRGFVALAQKDAARPPVFARISGNLHWPDEIDSYTPETDHVAKIWYARDVKTMARALGTEETLIILRKTDEKDAPIAPLPLNSAGIPNDHLQYAVTWFGLAAVWVLMTILYLRQMRAGKRRQQEGEAG